MCQEKGPLIDVIHRLESHSFPGRRRTVLDDAVHEAVRREDEIRRQAFSRLKRVEWVEDFINSFLIYESTFPAGLGRKQGYLLFHLLAFAFRTCGFALIMFAETLYQ